MDFSAGNSRDDRINALIVEYLEALERGTAPAEAEWLAANSEFQQELREFLSGYHRMSAAVLNCATHHGDSSLGADGSFADFRLLGELGRGGMGVVYEAIQLSLRRRVALKAIAPLGFTADSGTSEKLRSRFVQEAELTGGLQHPGIVPVYAAGTSPTGQPFYAMRLIDGTSLQAEIDALHQGASAQDATSGLEFRPLLRHFVDVCNAIEYAHSRQIIHRDIKPGNVMVGRFGETLVVDWGLAKGAPESGDAAKDVSLQDSQSNAHQTEHGARVGTPAYMSPEQAGGRITEVGPATDIYGLGATLYCLLTGRPPVVGHATPEALTHAERGEFPTPRSVNPRAPKPLEAVCLKAMALMPKDRYGSAKEVAAEVDRWLADEPVRAYREPMLNRLQRFARRHQALSSTVSAAAIIVAVGLAAGSWLLGQANERERLARNDADKSFRLAHGAVDEYFSRIANDNRLQQADLRPLRKELLKSTQGYYEQFVAERGNDPTLQAELGTALGRLGMLVLETEHKANALPLYERAIEVYETLTVAHPEVDAYWDELATKYNDAGLILQEMGQLDDAAARLHSALEIRERAAQRNATAIRLSDWAAINANLGIHYRLRGQLDLSERHHLRANEICQQLLQDPKNQGVADFQSKAAHFRYLLGNLYFTRGDLEQAESCYRESISRYEQLADSATPYVHFYRELPGVASNLARVHLERLQYDAAKDLMRTALEREERFAREHPSVTQHRFDLGSLYMLMSEACQATHEPDEAARYARQAVTSLSELIVAHPQIAQYQSALADASNRLGLTLDAAGRHKEAQQAYQDGIQVLDDYLAKRPEMQNLQIDLAALFANRGNSLADQSRYEEALDSFARAEEKLNGRLEGSPQVVRELLANICLGRAKVLIVLGRFTDAVQAADAGLALDTLPERNTMLMQEKAEALARSGAAETAFQLALELAKAEDADHQRQAAFVMLLAATAAKDVTSRNDMTEKGIALLRQIPNLPRQLLDEFVQEKAIQEIVATTAFQELLNEAIAR